MAALSTNQYKLKHATTQPEIEEISNVNAIVNNFIVVVFLKRLKMRQEQKKSPKIIENLSKNDQA